MIIICVYISETKLNAFYHWEYSDYYLHCYLHKVSTDATLGLLQVFHVELRSTQRSLSGKNCLNSVNHNKVQVLSAHKYFLWFTCSWDWTSRCLHGEALLTKHLCPLCHVLAEQLRVNLVDLQLWCLYQPIEDLYLCKYDNKVKSNNQNTLTTGLSVMIGRCLLDSQHGGCDRHPANVGFSFSDTQMTN